MHSHFVPLRCRPLRCIANCPWKAPATHRSLITQVELWVNQIGTCKDHTCMTPKPSWRDWWKTKSKSTGKVPWKNLSSLKRLIFFSQKRWALFECWISTIFCWQPEPACGSSCCRMDETDRLWHSKRLFGSGIKTWNMAKPKFFTIVFGMKKTAWRLQSYIHACIHTYIHTHTNICVCVNYTLFVCVCVCVCVCLFVCLCVCVYTPFSRCVCLRAPCRGSGANFRWMESWTWKPKSTHVF